MHTDDKRHEIARKLRETSESAWSFRKELYDEGIELFCDDQADYYLICKAITGYIPAEHMHPCDYAELHKQLANLIELEPERTCRMVRDERYSEIYEGPMLRCTRCEAAVPEYFTGSYNYCPNCGTKVMDK